LDSRAGRVTKMTSPVKPKPISNYFVNIANKTINIANILIKNLNLREASKYATSNEGLIIDISTLSEVMHFHYEGHHGT
jgi:hypothetical protein